MSSFALSWLSSDRHLGDFAAHRTERYVRTAGRGSLRPFSDTRFWCLERLPFRLMSIMDGDGAPTIVSYPIVSVVSVDLWPTKICNFCHTSKFYTCVSTLPNFDPVWLFMNSFYLVAWSMLESSGML